MTRAHATTPIIRLNRMGNLANYMIQVMAALAVKSHAPDSVIIGESLLEWNIHFPTSDDDSLVTKEVHTQKMDVRALGAMLQTGEIQRLSLMSYAQHIGNFLSRENYTSVFDAKSIAVEGYSKDFLVINIRAGEILDARHPYYTLLPTSFYKALIEQTQLTPVFMGQLGDDPYSMRLRKEFPSAIFEPSRGAMIDFEMIRRSKNIVPSVSTFSWLAAWLSDADQIHFPLSGLLNPMQTGEIDLLPLGDQRYRLYLFPINYAVEVHQLDKSHSALQGMWREFSHDMYAAIRRDRPRFSPGTENWMKVFSEDFYLKCHPDIQIAVQEGWFPSGREHFAAIGMAEGRAAFYFDSFWYSRSYPVAALEVAQGDFQDLRHHYVGIGRQRGYQPVDPAAVSG